MATLVCVRAKAVGLGGLSRQHVQRRQIVIPLDDRGLRAKPANRVRVQLPGRFGDGLCMRIDEQRRAWRRLVLFGGKAAEMEFRDGGCRKSIDEVVRVIAYVVATQIDVADVAE